MLNYFDLGKNYLNYKDNQIEDLIMTKFKYILVENCIGGGSKLLSVEENILKVISSDYFICIVYLNKDKEQCACVSFDSGKGNILCFDEWFSADAKCGNDVDRICGKPDTKIVISPQVANWMLDNGFRICHLKPDKIDPSRTVFVFYYEVGFDDVLAQYKKGIWYGYKE